MLATVAALKEFAGPLKINHSGLLTRRMDTAELLERLNQDITDTAAKAQEAQTAFLTAEDAQQGAFLEEVWQQWVKRGDGLIALRSRLL